MHRTQSPCPPRSRFDVRFAGCSPLPNALAMPLLIVAASLAPASAEAAVIAGFDAVRHNRFLTGFESNPAFFINEGLISGVALNRATLITPQHYVTARHANTSAPIFRGSDGVVRTYATAGGTTLTLSLIHI